MVTKIYVDKVELDLGGDFDLNLNYQIADIREVDKKATSFSYSITLPGSPINNKIFGHIYELGNDNITFNPNKKLTAQVYVDGNQIFQGFIQLVKVNRYEDDQITYDVSLIGPLGNLFYDIGEGKLEDIDFSMYDHILCRSGITKSWDTEIIRDGQYIPFQYGRGYVYPMIQYGVNTTTTTNVEEMFPAIYAKEYFDRIFEDAGYTYKSEFLNSSYFKQLIVPFSREKILLTDEQIAQRSAHRKTSSIQAQGADPTVVQEKIMWPTWDTTVSDPGGSFVTNQIWLCKKKGRYRFDVAMLMALYFDSDGTYPFFIVGGPVTGSVKLEVAGNLVYELPFSMGFTSGPHAGGVTFPSPQTFSFDLNLVKGDYVYIRVDWTYPESNYTSKIVNVLGQGLNGVFQMRVLPDSYFKVTAYNDGIVESDPVSMNLTTPEDITKKDYIKSIFSMFNLMVLDDPTTPKSLIIEPRDDFYKNGGEFLDWTNKLDRTEYSTIPLYELENKIYKYAYKADNDFYNDKYQTSFGRTYGDVKIEIDNDFLTNEKTLDLVFSPTPNAKDASTNLSMPHFLTYDNAGKPKTKKTNIRLLFYSGLKTGSWNLYSTLEIPNSSPRTTYPYVGMQNDPLNPTHDLVFDNPKSVYYLMDTWTDANLFNEFHKNTFSDLANKNSKLLTGYFDLTPADIAKLDFRNKILIDGIYWRINKVEGYSPIDNKLTKVELFSLTDPFLHVPTVKPLKAGPNTPLSGLTATDFGTPVPYFDPVITTPILNGNIVNSVTVTTHGSDNTVGSNVEATIIGSENLVSDNTSGILVIGTGNTIASNLTNVVVLGSNNRNITESNVVVIDNSFIYRSGSGPIPLVDLVDGGYDEIQNPFNRLVALDVLDGGHDHVREYGSSSTVFVVDSGLDGGLLTDVPTV